MSDDMEAYKSACGGKPSQVLFLPICQAIHHSHVLNPLCVKLFFY